MFLTRIKQFCVRFRSGDQAARRRRVRHMRLWAADVPQSRLMLVATLWVSFFKSIVAVSAALTLFLDSMGQARADFITVTAQPTFQTMESASITPMTAEGFPEQTQQQTYTNPAAGATNQTFNMYTLSGSAAASVDTFDYNNNPSSLTDYVLLSSSAQSDAGTEGDLYEYQSATVAGSASLQGPTFTLNQPASAVLTFDPTLALGTPDKVPFGEVLELAGASVMLQGNNGSSMEVTAQLQALNGFAQFSQITAETETAGPSSIQTVYGGADSVEMNLAPGTYSISGSSGVSIDYGIDNVEFDSLSVNGAAELVFTAIGGPPSPTPEPATFTLLSSGLFGFGGWRRWRKRRVA
jgi:hypothetical protein